MALRGGRLISIAAFGISLAVSLPVQAQTRITLDVPVSVRADDVRKALEASVPSSDVRLGAWEYIGDLGFKAGAWRTPFTVKTTAAGLSITTTIEYEAHAYYRLKLPFGKYAASPEVSCGSGEPRASFQLGIDVGGTWLPGWSFDLKSNIAVTPLRPCKLSVANIDVTERVSSLIKSKIAAEIDKIRGRLHFRAAADKLWAAAGVRKLDDHLWLVWRPEEVAVTPLKGGPDEIQSSAAIHASASIVESATAPPSPSLPPLTVLPVPTVSPSAEASQLWQVSVASTWADLARAAASMKSIDIGNGINVGVQNLAGTSDGHVVVTVGVTGTPGGPVVIDARARYDAPSDEILVDDLHAAAGTNALTAALLPAATASLAARLRWKVEPHLREIMKRLEQTGFVKGIDTSPGGRSIHAVTVTKDGIVVDVAFSGALTLPAAYPQ